MSSLKGKQARGRSYDRKLIRAMMEDGYRANEIAKKLDIKSVQSLRHTMEQISREKESQEKIKSEKEKEKKQPIEIGLIPNVADRLVISAMDKVLRTLNSQDSAGLIFMSTIDGKVIMLSDESSDLNMKVLMSGLGFYGQLCSKKHSYDVLKVKFPGRNFVNVDKTILTEGIFNIENKGDEGNRFEKIIAPYVDSVDFSYSNINNMHFTDACSKETYKQIKSKINETGIHFHLTYDPFYAFPEKKFYLMGAKDGILTFAPADYMGKIDRVILELRNELIAKVDSEILRSNVLLCPGNIDIDSLRIGLGKICAPSILKKYDEKMNFIEIPYAGNGKIEAEVKKRLETHANQFRKYIEQEKSQNYEDPLQSLVEALWEKTLRETIEEIKKIK